jgi:hypothetical protein
MRRLLSWVGGISLVCIAVLSLARAFRSDGAMWVEDFDSARAASLAAVVKERFSGSTAIDVTYNGNQVTPDGLLAIQRQMPNLRVTSTPQARIDNGFRIEKIPTDDDEGRIFNVYLTSAPLYRVWIMHVRTGASCGYSVTLVQISHRWHTLSTKGGCVRSTPVTILDRDAQQPHAARRER